MSGVKWIKIQTDMFDNPKIKYIRSMPDGDRMLLVWVAILTMAGRCNSKGMLILADTIPYTEEMIASEFDFELNTVRVAIQLFCQLNMLTSSDNGLLAIPGWDEYQSADKLEDMKRKDRERKREKRAEQKKLSVSESSEEKPSKGKSDTVYQRIVGYLNEVCGTSYRSATKDTQTHIRARLNEGFTEEDFKTVIDFKASQWLHDGRMKEYLRPCTLFSTKFENYLENAKRAKKVPETVVEETEPEDTMTDEEWLAMMEESEK